jgi:rhodanese-related sulfurtransferase
MPASAVAQAGLLIALSLAAGAIRGFLPNSIAWNGRWPTAETSAEEAYKMMAQPGDPAFASLSESIQLHSAGATFIDARSSDEFAAGRIPGARSLPFYELEAREKEALNGLKPEDPIVIYCEGVGCELSLFLGRELAGRGFTNLRIFYGGYPEWQGAGLKIEK